MSRWLRYEPSDAAVALLCLPHAGGGAGSFNRWLGLFPPTVLPVRVQLPGREDLAALPAPRDAGQAVDGLMEQVRQLDRPVALYGHSMGALIAFELARSLTAAGTPPVHLFLSGRRAPQLPARRRPIHHLPDDEFAAALETMGGTLGSGTGSAAFLRYAVPLIKADLRLTEEYAYRPGPALRCPIDAFVGTEDPVVDADEVRAWREHTAAAFRVHTFPGDHFFHQRHRAAIAGTIVEGVQARAVETLAS
ncbi:alpha/beta fold hydrolase [Catellatospora sp. NPDC049609]|uniref:thioesterase II family protein n=1 Tax=Catellatospora sp. NPDC049609 TaxID=3155505 RepID=UPI00342F728A